MIDPKRKSNFYRTAKERVRKYVLEPAGFVKGADAYVRHAGDQVHAIQFQANRYGGSYFVNVAFHFAFLPGFLAGRHLDVRSYHVLDFLFHTRLEELLGPRLADNLPEWKYGNSAEETEYFLGRNARNAISAIEGYALQWADPTVFIKSAPPSLILDELRESREFEQRRSIEPSIAFDLQKHPLLDAIGSEWITSIFSVTYALTSVALRSGLTPLAIEYNDVLVQVTENPHDAKMANELGAAIRQVVSGRPV